MARNFPEIKLTPGTVRGEEDTLLGIMAISYFYNMFSSEFSTKLSGISNYRFISISPGMHCFIVNLTF